MSYHLTAAMMFDSATESVRHTGAASAIVTKLSYIDMNEHAEKIAECDRLLRSLQDEADRRRPAATAGGLVGKLASSTVADHKATVAAVARYFATAAGHIYRRSVKTAMTRAVNAISAGETPPADELSAIQYVAGFIDPVNVPFIGTKRGCFIVEWESLRGRFVRLSEGAFKRRQKAEDAAVQLAQLRAALDAAGLSIEDLTAGVA